jgi:GT2 family glycosyltransferase
MDMDKPPNREGTSRPDGAADTPASAARAAPDVSVIVVTLNGEAILRNCLRGLAAQDRSSVEVIVVDNGSSEDIRGLLAAEFPSVRAIRSETNLGFAGGNNLGIAAARGAYIALINNDAVAAADWLSAMVRRAESDPRIGAVACAVLDGNKPDAMDSFGVGVALDGMSRQAWRGVAPRDLPPAGDVLAASGCACLFRKTALDEVGAFDPRFFAYCEDTDLSLRLRYANWRVVTEPAARVTHFYSRTGGAFSLRKVFWVERNHYWVALKNYPWPLVLALPLTTAWRWLAQFVAWQRRAGDLEGFFAAAGFGAVAWTLVRANFAALLGVPAILRERLCFRPPRRLRGGAWLRLLLRHRLSAWEVLTGRRPGARR